MTLVAEMCTVMKILRMLSRWAESRIISFVSNMFKPYTLKHIRKMFLNIVFTCVMSPLRVLVLPPVSLYRFVHGSHPDLCPHVFF
jgi:hypothetical protein